MLPVNAEKNSMAWLLFNPRGAELKLRRRFMNNSLENKESLSGNVARGMDTAREKSREFAATAAEKTNELARSLGNKVKGLGNTVREKSPHDTVRDATNKVADKLESAGTYLENLHFDNIIDSFSGVIRRYPLQAFAFGISVGFFLARRK
jgi:hypothetical protein